MPALWEIVMTLMFNFWQMIDPNPRVPQPKPKDPHTTEHTYRTPDGDTITIINHHDIIGDSHAEHLRG